MSVRKVFLLPGDGIGPEATAEVTKIIDWMNESEYLRKRADTESKQVHFDGERLDPIAVWRARYRLFPPQSQQP